jgi:type I restriction enzyme S subunit
MQKVKQKTKDWEKVKLGDVADIHTGEKDVNEGNPNGKYPFFTCARGISYSDNYSFNTEAILIAGNGEVGETKYYKGKFEAYQRTYVLDDFNKDIRYVYYCLKGLLKPALGLQKSGSTMPYIRKGDLEKFEILVPKDKNHQQKIVKVLDAAQEAVEAQDKLIKKTQELKRATMHKLFTQGTRGEKQKKTKIGKIPENWKIKKLGEEKLFDIVLGGTPSTSNKNYWNGSIKWITPPDLRELESPFIKETKRTITEEGLKKGSKVVPSGSIILSTRAPVGYVGVTSEKMAFNQGCKAVVIKDLNRIDSRFIYYFLIMQTDRLNSLSSGSTFRELPTHELKAVEIILPDIEEQKEIANILQKIDEKIEIHKKKKERHGELFQSLLHKLMGGEIKIDNIKIARKYEDRKI